MTQGMKFAQGRSIHFSLSKKRLDSLSYCSIEGVGIALIAEIFGSAICQPWPVSTSVSVLFSFSFFKRKGEETHTYTHTHKRVPRSLFIFGVYFSVFSLSCLLLSRRVT